MIQFISQFHPLKTYAISHAPLLPQYPSDMQASARTNHPACYAHKSCTIAYQGFQLWSPLNSFTNACHSCQSGMWLQYTNCHHSSILYHSKQYTLQYTYCHHHSCHERRYVYHFSIHAVRETQRSQLLRCVDHADTAAPGTPYATD